MQAEGTAGAKVLNWVCAWHSKRTARRPTWLEQSEQEGGEMELETRT